MLMRFESSSQIASALKRWGFISADQPRVCPGTDYLIDTVCRLISIFLNEVEIIYN